MAEDGDIRSIDAETQKERQKLLAMIMERQEHLDKREMALQDRERALLEREKKLEDAKQKLLAFRDGLKKNK